MKQKQKVLIVGSLAFTSQIRSINESRLAKPGGIIIDNDPVPRIRRYVDDLAVVIVDVLMPGAVEKVGEIRKEFTGPIIISFSISDLGREFYRFGTEALIEVDDVPKKVREILRR